MASESTHWYDQTGNPCYTIIGANGKERNTTLRDARKFGYVPSVTTVMGVMAKPGLERWKIDQALMAALTLPRIEGESLDDFKKRAAEDAKQHAIQAADLGTSVHASLESYFTGGPYLAEHKPFVEAASRVIDETFPNTNWHPEKSFCSPLGYGGKVDLHSSNVVIDFKTKEFGPDDKIKAYDEQIMQLDAYRHGLGYPKALMANLFISVSHPGEVRLIVHPEGRHYEMFCHLLNFWKLSKGYDPMEQAA